MRRSIRLPVPVYYVPASCTSTLTPRHVLICRAALRGYVLARSRGRMLVHGGLGNLDPEALVAAAAGKPSGGRAAEVFDAFVRFRDRHCQGGESPAEASKDRLEEAWAQAVESRSGLGDGEGEPPAAPALLWWEQDRPAVGSEAAEEARARSSLVGQDEDAAAEGAASENAPAGPGARGSFEECTSAREVARLSTQAQASALRRLRAGEVLHILRPLVYVSLLRRWGLRSWRPWALSLAVDLASRRLCDAATQRSRTAAARAAASPAVQGTSMTVLYRLQGLRFTEPEREELARRRAALLYYLLRDPLFARRTRPARGRGVAARGGAPGLGWAGAKLLEIVDGMQQLYTYTSAS